MPRSPSAFSDHPSLLVQETPSGSPGLLPISKNPKYQDELAIGIGLWAARAVDANIIAYQDARIEPLIAEIGRCARAGDIAASIAARARCSANLFFSNDVEDARSDEYEIDQDGAAQVYIRDLERLLVWILNNSRLGDLTLWAEFLKLGAAARAAVARPEVHKEYNARKRFCIGWAAVAIGLERRSPALRHYSENVRKHFRVDGKAAHIPDRVASLEPEHREALRGVPIWLDPNDDDFAHLVETEYTSMVTSSMNEAEFSVYALSTLLKNERRNPYYISKESDQCLLPERLVQPVNKPDGHLWIAPPAVSGPSNYSWDIRPDCAYWISLRALRHGFRHKGREHAAVLQKRLTCPYFTLEFKKDSDKNISRAHHQVAIAACIAVYNRWELKRSAVTEWTQRHRDQLGHYCLTFTSSVWDVWHVTPKTFENWSGCRMCHLYSGDCTTRESVVQLIRWINEIHY